MSQQLAAYLEQNILASDGVGLVRILYRACIEQVREARQAVLDGRISARAASISRACDMLGELINSLDMEAGGELSQNLLALYTYMQSRLLDATIRRDERPLSEVMGLLTTLAEGWDQIPARKTAECASSNSMPFFGSMSVPGDPAACQVWSA